MVREHGIEFIGPLPEQINLMGDKSTARETMKRAGVPTVPGSPGIIRSTEEALRVADVSARGPAAPWQTGVPIAALDVTRASPAGDRLPGDDQGHGGRRRARHASGQVA